MKPLLTALALLISGPVTVDQPLPPLPKGQENPHVSLPPDAGVKAKTKEDFRADLERIIPALVSAIGETTKREAKLDKMLWAAVSSSATQDGALAILDVNGKPLVLMFVRTGGGGWQMFPDQFEEKK